MDKMQHITCKLSLMQNVFKHFITPQTFAQTFALSVVKFGTIKRTFYSHIYFRNP